MNNSKLIALRDALNNLSLDELIGLNNVAAANVLYQIKTRCDELTGAGGPAYVQPAYCGDAFKELMPYSQPGEYFSSGEMLAMGNGRKIDAIKGLRSRFNLPLKDAKDLIEEGMRRWFPQYPRTY